MLVKECVTSRALHNRGDSPSEAVVYSDFITAKGVLDNTKQRPLAVINSL